MFARAMASSEPAYPTTYPALKSRSSSKQRRARASPRSYAQKRLYPRAQSLSARFAPLIFAASPAPIR